MWSSLQAVFLQEFSCSTSSACLNSQGVTLSAVYLLLHSELAKIVDEIHCTNILTPARKLQQATPYLWPCHIDTIVYVNTDC